MKEYKLGAQTMSMGRRFRSGTTLAEKEDRWAVEPGTGEESDYIWGVEMDGEWKKMVEVSSIASQNVVTQQQFLPLSSSAELWPIKMA